ncbi:hypothetical protein [Denitromonas iodatirespirans]|uniref:Uncharacterized protein n=1 Tax=Denitromonas iodatirespirans TaxID=2795389 RepID=A0A944DEZ2_DENI1|nr:hypothetical protein [Denitromonas iodatirespirans]MBT0963766.1 hypothetical protein [Denitromonas iodatirespirans]
MRHTLEPPFEHVRVLDSIAELQPDDRGQIVVCGSHGGQSAADYALAHPPSLVIFNDAGIGKDKAGIVALDLLDAAGICAAAVGHDSARIGDALDTWHSGRLTHCNRRAERIGCRPGDTVPASVQHALALQRYRLCRMDDNGNRFVVMRALSREQADSERARFESLGHKQTYWIEPEAPADMSSDSQ